MKNKPAFPTTQYADGISPSGFDPGMTLRDYFAAKAMQAMLSRHESITCPDEILAQDAYNTADAMMEAREA